MDDLKPGERRLYTHPQAGHFYVNRHADQTFFCVGRHYTSEVEAIAGFYAACHTSTLATVEILRDALLEARPFLIRLGDFIGNGETSESGLGTRCDAVLHVRQALDLAQAELGGDEPLLAACPKCGAPRVDCDTGDGQTCLHCDACEGVL